MNNPGNIRQTIPILTYHSIDGSGSVISTSPETFRCQMQCVHESSFNVVPLGELMRVVRERRQLPARPLVITFDDGYRNVRDAALPILRQYGFTATVFLITGYCGRHNDWPGQWAAIERRPLLSWAEVAEMHEEGVEFGSHTATHPDLTGIPLSQAEAEIQQSKAAIEDRLGAEVTTFCYPYGKHNAPIRELAQRDFHSACSTRLGQVSHNFDPYLLKRVEMYYFSNLTLFRAMLANRANWYLNLRQAFRDLKEVI